MSEVPPTLRGQVGEKGVVTVRFSRAGLVVLVVVLLVGVALPASTASAADPTGLSNVELIAAPSTVKSPAGAPAGPRALDRMFLFPEQTNLPPGTVLLNDVAIDMTAKVSTARGAVVRAGTTVRSYYVVCTPPTAGTRVTITGTMTFDEPIIGVIGTTAHLAASDADLGAQENLTRIPITEYGGAYQWRGVESNSADRVTIGADGKTLTVQCDASVTDQVRVLIGVLPNAYVALGDSLSSGEGTGGLAPGTPRAPTGGYVRVGYVPATAVRGTDECHRGNVGASYPELVNAAMGFNDFRHVACSGARLANLFTRAQIGDTCWFSKCTFNNGPQLGAITKPEGGNRVSRDFFVNLVTYSIGINDALFSETVRACMYTDSPSINTALRFFAGNCATTGATHTATGIATIKKEYPKLLSWIHRTAPVAAIRILGYPDSFPGTPTAPCVIGTRPDPISGIASFYWSDTTDTLPASQLRAMTLLDGWQLQMNGAINTAVTTWVTAWNTAHATDQVNAKFVSNVITMAPNYICNAALPATWSFNGVLFDPNNDPMAESLHPNVAGHLALSRAVLASLP